MAAAAAAAVAPVGDWWTPGGEPLLDVFGPLMRFLLRPRPAVAAAASDFITRHLVPSRATDGLPSPVHTLVGVHVRMQDSSHSTHALAHGAASQARLSDAVRRCAAKRVALAGAEAADDARPAAEATGGGVAVFVASDHDETRRSLVEHFRSLPGVVAAGWYDPPHASSAFVGGAASRSTTDGFFAAAVELTILSRSHHLLQAGNRGFSSYGLTAAGMAPQLRSQTMVNHPCDVEWRHMWGEGLAAEIDDSDCLEQLHPQPWLNLRWLNDGSALERRRVGCQLVDPADGAAKPLVARLHAKGAMDINCVDVQAMARAQGRWRSKQEQRRAAAAEEERRRSSPPASSQGGAIPRDEL